MPLSSDQLTSPSDDVADQRQWGDRIQGSGNEPRISNERMPSELIAAMAMVKRACANANRDLDRLHPDLALAIDFATAQVIAGQRDQDFPMSVWQTASTAPTHANMNQVLARLATESLDHRPGTEGRVQADEHVNMGQSTAQVFTTALHVAVSVGLAHNLLPALAALRAELSAKAESCRHGGPAATSMAQEIHGHLAQLASAYDAIERALPSVHQLAMHERMSPEFGEQVAKALTQALGLPFVNAPNQRQNATSLDTLLSLHGTLKSAALALMNISADMRQRASDAQSSTTQCDALTMVCCQVMGNDVSLTIGATTGPFEGCTFKPLMAHNLLQSIRLLTDATTVFTEFFVRGIPMHRERISHGLASSLMLVAARVPQA
ncbi:MAG: class II fumarate hydratase [Rubrivivax sp.]|nr:MAG: class II fumarate hydratase [Rubrivivax sp.]